MNLVKRIDQYSEDNVYFCEPIKNNIMNDGFFIRILYSTHNLVLNGIFILMNLNDITCEKYYNKYKCTFNTVTHKELIDQIRLIEENILKKLNFKNKNSQFKIYEQLKNGNIKIFNEIFQKNNVSFILKISGVWETQFNYGLTYKFIKCNN
jgi:hypothetical protein